MVERMGEGSEGLGAIFPAMLNAMMALRVLGYPDDHPFGEKADKDFARFFVDDPEDFRIQPCLSPVWDTAITTIALAESGLAKDHAALQEVGRLAGKEGGPLSRAIGRCMFLTSSRVAGPSSTKTSTILTPMTP